jgi:D-glycero-D-manno-heptose 1,7-bisphosphate phosphatase
MKDCLSALRSQGYLLIGITNQPDVARGYVSQDTATSLNKFIASQVGLDAIYCCFHDNKHDCSCRKPKAGLFLQAQSEWAIAFNRSFVVGDRWKDIEAARNAQIASIFIDYDYQETKPSHQQLSVRTPIQACQYILSQLIS